MIQIIAGLQGAGKTKSLIDLANAESKTTHGHLVYVDADNSHILQLSHKIRLIKPDDYPLESPDEFFGFVCGILSQDYDICTVYIDGLMKNAKTCLLYTSMDRTRRNTFSTADTGVFTKDVILFLIKHQESGGSFGDRNIQREQRGSHHGTAASDLGRGTYKAACRLEQFPNAGSQPRLKGHGMGQRASRKGRCV